VLARTIPFYMPSRNHYSTRLLATAGLGILTLGLFLRLRLLDTTAIWGDQSFTLNTAMRWVNGGPMPFAANKSSAGFMNPPMIEYIYALALRVWPDILSAAIITMIAGVIGLIVTGWSVSRVFGPGAALWTTLLFAVNPWSVYYSQLIWNQTMVPVFACLTLSFMLLYFAVSPQAVYMVAALVAAACMTQVHPGTSIQLVTMALIGFLFWRKLRLWPLVTGMAAFALLYVPYLVYEINVGWEDAKAVLSLAGQPAGFSAAALLVSLDLVRAQGLLSSVAGVVWFDTLATLLLVVAVGYAVLRAVRAVVGRGTPHLSDPAEKGLLIVLLWFALPILFYIRPSQHLQVYYLIGQLPSHFILLGVLFAAAIRRLQRTRASIAQLPKLLSTRTVLTLVASVPLMTLAAWQAGFDLKFQDHRAASPEGPPQIRHIRSLVDASQDLLDEHGDCRLVVVSEGYSLEHSQLSLLREFVSGYDVILTDGRLSVPLPASCAIYLDALPSSRASDWLLKHASPVPDAHVSVRAQRWRFLEIAEQQRSDIEREWHASEPAVYTWTNGIQLAHAEVGALRQGKPLHLTLAWYYDGPRPETAYHLGTYLLDGEQQVVAQYDGPGFDSIQWTSGDAFITWSEIPVPAKLEAEDYQIAAAWYEWPNLTRVNLVNGGNTAFLTSRRWAE
jgi:hypothetical protein